MDEQDFAAVVSRLGCFFNAAFPKTASAEPEPAPKAVKVPVTDSSIKKEMNETIVDMPIYFSPIRNPRSSLRNPHVQDLLSKSCLKVCATLENAISRQVAAAALLLRTLPSLRKEAYWTDDSRTMYFRILISLFKNAEYAVNFKDHCTFNKEDLGIFIARTLHQGVDPWSAEEGTVSAAETDGGMVAVHKLVVGSILHWLMRDDPEVHEDAFEKMHELGIMARDDPRLDSWMWPDCFANEPKTAHAVPYYRKPIAETDHTASSNSSPKYQVIVMIVIAMIVNVADSCAAFFAASCSPAPLRATPHDVRPCKCALCSQVSREQAYARRAAVGTLGCLEIHEIDLRHMQIGITLFQKKIPGSDEYEYAKFTHLHNGSGGAKHAIELLNDNGGTETGLTRDNQWQGWQFRLVRGPALDAANEIELAGMDPRSRYPLISTAGKNAVFVGFADQSIVEVSDGDNTHYLVAQDNFLDSSVMMESLVEAGKTYSMKNVHHVSITSDTGRKVAFPGANVVLVDPSTGRKVGRGDSREENTGSIIELTSGFGETVTGVELPFVDPANKAAGVDLNRMGTEIEWSRADQHGRRTSRVSVDPRAAAAVCLTGCYEVHTPTEEQNWTRGVGKHGTTGKGARNKPERVVEMARTSGDVLKVGDACFLGLKKVRPTSMPQLED